MEIIRKRIRFTGRVQGVGFRYRAKYAAQSFCMSGWVRNEPDGSVLMEIQGTQDQINRVLTMINSSHYIEIDWMYADDIPVEKDNRFRII